MQPELPFSHSQEPSAGPYPEQDNTVHTTQSDFSKIPFNIIFQPTYFQVFLVIFILLAFPPKILLHECYITLTVFGPSILLSALCSSTFSLCSSLNVRDQVSHSYRTTGKIIVLYIIIFTFSDSRRKIEGSELNGSKHYPNSISF
jgi:hypothetical protein